MRIDLHNHTINYSRVPSLYRKDLENIYARIIQHRDVDGFAITNYHDIQNALRLQQKLPEHIIIGCEYRVLQGENYFHVVVLEVDQALHTILLSARLRGVEYFTNILRENSRVFFLVRMAWGLSQDSPDTTKLLESTLDHFKAIKTLNAVATHESQFARKLASYYHLTPIGGSDSIINDPGRRAYTEAKSATNTKEFIQAILDNDVQVGLTQEKSNISPYASGAHNNFWNWTKSIRWSKILDNWGETILLPTLQKIPKATHVRRVVRHQKKIVQLEKAFIDDLKLKETRRIFDTDKPLAGKQQMWKQAMERINQSFVD